MQKHTESHFTALDVALGAGLEVDHGGKTWTFSALSFDDFAALSVRARSDAMKVYEEAHAGKPVEAKQRAMDLNAIMFGSLAQEVVTNPLNTPGVRSLAVWLSVRKKHPEVKTETESTKLFLDDDAFATAIVEKITLMSHGPLKPTEAEERPT